MSKQAAAGTSNTEDQVTRVKAATSNDERMRQVEQPLAIGNLEGAVSDPQTMGNLMEFALGHRTADLLWIEVTTVDTTSQRQRPIRSVRV